MNPQTIKNLFLALAILTFGTMNTFLAKFQNRQSFECEEMTYDCEICTEDQSGCIDFEQPFFQSFFTFAGECMCLIAYIFVYLHRRFKMRKGELLEAPSKLKGWNYLLFIFPAAFDVIGTCLMNWGLVYTHASVYQMLRGIVVVFTGTFAVLFLKRRLYSFHWLGIVLVVLGVGTVGLTSILMAGDTGEAKNPLLGDILVVVAQIFISFQMISEEKILHKYDAHPLQVVGIEGVFGIIIIVSVISIFQVTIGDNGVIGNIFDVRFALEVFHYVPILVPSLLFIVTYAGSNFFGVWTTQVLGATARTTIEQCRTLTVWLIGLGIGWETFLWPQILGFIVLVGGTFMYNRVYQVPCLTYPTISQAQIEKRSSSIHPELIPEYYTESEENLLNSRKPINYRTASWASSDSQSDPKQ